MTPEQAARRVFGERAAQYVSSAAHADAQVLARVVELARPRPGDRALDVATGAGHTALALAPRCACVVATDLTPEMLAEARRLAVRRGVANIDLHLADVHHLPYCDSAFDVVVSRRAPHHFSRIRVALAEMRRVLAPDGRLVIDDRSVPEDDFVDTTMDALDRLHDESHVRQYRASEWRAMLAASGFAVEIVEPYVRHRPVSSFTDGVSPENARRIRATLDGLDARGRAALDLREVEGVLHGNHWYVTIAAGGR